MFDGKLGSISNKRFVIIGFRQIKAAKIQASLDNISYNENVGLSPMIPNDLAFNGEKSMPPSRSPCGLEASLEEVIEENKRLHKQLRETELE